MILWLILSIALFLFVFFHVVKKLYFVSIDHTLMCSGAPRTGKTNEMVSMAKKLFRLDHRKVRFHNFWQSFKFPLFRSYEVPCEIFSNIPIRVGRLKKKEYIELFQASVDKYSDSLNVVVIARGLVSFKVWLQYHFQPPEGIRVVEIKRDRFCKVLKIEHLLLTERLPKHAIVVITEIGKIASQYVWGNLNVQDNVDEFASLICQYTLGGYFLCDDQASDNVAVNIRRRLGTVINMLHFRHFWKFYWVRMRNITISEDIKSVEEGSAEDNMRTRIGMFPLFYRVYDPYAFSERYREVPEGVVLSFVGFKTNSLMSLPVAYARQYQGQSLVDGERVHKKVINFD